MKKLLRFLPLLMFYAIQPAKAQYSSAGNFEYNGIYYAIRTSPDKAVQKVCVGWKGTFYDSYEEYAGDITIPSSVTPKNITYYVTEIHGCAFWLCTNLTSIIISNGITYIYGDAFNGCTGLKSASIPASTKHINSDAFRGCYSLECITIDSLNPNYDTRNNCNAIIKTSTNELMHGCQNTIIPNTITSIGNYAFYNNSKLKAITIPSSVTSIGRYAFEGCSSLNSLIVPGSINYISQYSFCNCSSLESLIISEGVANIGHSAFKNCNSLNNVSLPQSLIKIDYYAFSACNNLQQLTIPQNVQSIGNYAFLDCFNLNSVTCESTTPPEASSTSFENIDSNATLYVPIGTKTAYASATGWKVFTNIVETNSTTHIEKTEVGNNVFEVARYDIHGRLLKQPTEGINIVKMSDGTTRKVIVK